MNESCASHISHAALCRKFAIDLVHIPDMLLKALKGTVVYFILISVSLLTGYDSDRSLMENM